MARFVRGRQVARSALSAVATGVVAVWAHPAMAQAGDQYTTNDYGGIGLLQTRTARFAPDGEFEIGASFVNPYRRYYMTWQILPWLEATFRYTDTTNLPNGGLPVPQGQWQFFKDILNFRGGGTNLDRGADLKFRIFKEGDTFPEVAVGVQDFIGTGLFSGEYIVASKRYYDFDFTWGVGWGYLGSRGSLPNPFRFLPGFGTRNANVGQGGKVLIGDLFAGRHVGLFGGVEYHTPIKGLTLKLEYNGANPKKAEPNGNFLKESLPINAGIDYRPVSWFDLGLAFERGNSVMIKTSFRFNLHSRGLPKFDEAPVPVVPRTKNPGAAAPTKTSDEPAPSQPSPQSPTPMPAIDAAAQDFARREFARLPLDQKLAATMTDAGFAVQSVRLDRAAARATVTVDAPYWMASEDYREAAAGSLDAAGGALGRVTLVSTLKGVEVSTTTAQADSAPQATAAPAATAQDYPDRIFKGLAAQGYTAYAVYISDLSAVVYISHEAFREPARNVGRVARVMANNLPPSVEAITVVGMADGVPTSKVTVIRHDIERAAEREGSPEEIWADATMQAPEAGLDLPEGTVRNEHAYPRFSWALSPGIRQHIGDPQEGIYLADVSAVLSAKVDVLPGLSIRATGNKFLFGNLSHITRQSNSVLPHVRSDVVNYLQHGRSGLTRLQADYLFNPLEDVYARLSVGLFEWMYGGVGGEVLYRPFDSRFAIGLDVNWVKQRDFNVLFDFRHYQVVTGHLSLYYDLPVYNIQAAVHIGRYLAKDRGATFDISRQFENGIRLGAFATFTNVSSKDFGEGSFDKGFYMVIPLDLFMLKSSKSYARFDFRPLTRDGGQMLDITPRLYNLTSRDNRRALKNDWTNFLD
jgi:hypothetical protein